MGRPAFFDAARASALPLPNLNPPNGELAFSSALWALVGTVGGRAFTPRRHIAVVHSVHLWNLVEEWFANFGLPIEMKLLDRYHLFERLAQIAELLEREQRDRWILLERWRASLDRSDTAIRRICKEIEDRVYEPMPRRRFPIGIDWPLERTPKIPTYKERVIEGHLTYCKNHRDKMRYASARRCAYPIGSGPTEGACKSLIAARLKRSGQRWFEQGASACLQLRTLYLNNRLRRAFEVFGEHRRRGIETS